MKPKIDYSIYLVTDRGLMSTATIEESVEQAIKGGATVVQLREKTAESGEFYELACRVKEITLRHNIPLIINDRVDIALAVNAEGVHIGQGDIPADVVRKIIGNNMVLGVSTTTIAQSQKAQADGADYLGVGAMFPTNTKDVADYTTMEDLAEIRSKITIPLVVIGGINKTTIPMFAGTGIDGAAVVSAIVAQPDITAAAREIKEIYARTMAQS